MLLLWGSMALAVDEVEFAAADTTLTESVAPVTTLSAELGGAFASGNSVYQTLNSALTGSQRWSANRISLDGSTNVTSSVIDSDGDGILNETERAVGLAESARRYEGELRYDRYLGDKQSLYALLGGFVDPFAGYDRRTHEQLGYSRIFVDDNATHLVGELGADVAQENYVEGIEPNTSTVYAGRAMVGVVHQLNESVTVSEKAETYVNILDADDFRVLNELAISSQISSALSLKLSQALTYDNVPVTGYRPMDMTTMVTLVATLLDTSGDGSSSGLIDDLVDGLASNGRDRSDEEG